MNVAAGLAFSSPSQRRETDMARRTTARQRRRRVVGVAPGRYVAFCSALASSANIMSSNSAAGDNRPSPAQNHSIGVSARIGEPLLLHNIFLYGPCIYAWRDGFCAGAFAGNRFFINLLPPPSCRRLRALLSVAAAYKRLTRRMPALSGANGDA